MMRTLLCAARYYRVVKNERTIVRARRRVGRPTVACPRCKKPVSPPERLAEQFPRCERRAVGKPTVLFR